MSGILSSLSPMEVTLAVVALVGAVPVVLQYRERSRWFAAGYGALVVAALATNAENLFLGELLNIVEHGVGLMGAGLAFFAAAYVHRRQRVAADRDGAGDGERGSDPGSGGDGGLAADGGVSLGGEDAADGGVSPGGEDAADDGGSDDGPVTDGVTLDG